MITTCDLEHNRKHEGVIDWLRDSPPDQRRRRFDAPGKICQGHFLCRFVLFHIVEMVTAITALHQGFRAPETDLRIEPSHDVRVRGAVQAVGPFGVVGLAGEIGEGTLGYAHLHALIRLFNRVHHPHLLHRFPQ